MLEGELSKEARQQRSSGRRVRQAVSLIPGDRRRARRYEIGLPLRFRTDDGLTGTGAMKDISRTGMRFLTDAPLRVSSHIEITAEWPVPLRGLYPTELKALGIVSRVGK